MKSIGVVRLVVVWLAFAVLLYWAKGLPAVKYNVPYLSQLVGVEFTLYGLLFPTLWVPLALTWLAFPARAPRDTVVDNTVSEDLGGVR